MTKKSLLFALWLACGLFGVDGDEVKSVSVMEGDSVTLHTDVTELQTEIQILWTFEATRIAEIYKRDHTSNFFVLNDGLFRECLQMNNQTGSLTITNIKTEHSGLYKLQINRDQVSYKSFAVIVHAPLPVPVISRNSSQCSSSSERSSVCVLLCSVLNVSHVSLSWYKGSSLLSSISVSDLNIRLSLPLEVDYEDNNTYTCVLNNTITNNTQHLHNNKLCHKCSALTQNPHLVGVFLVMLVVVTAAVGGMCFLYSRRSKHTRRAVQAHDEEEIHYAETTFCTRHEIPKADDPTVYSSVALG